MKLLALALLAAAPSLPKRDVMKAVRAAVADVKEVTDVLADIGDGRYPILFTTRGRDCSARTVDGQKDESCAPTTRPHVGIVRRGAAGLALEAELALPTEAAPEWLSRGINAVKDFDGELMLAYGYHGPSDWAVGDTWYKHWCILNLDKLAPAICVVVDRLPQAGVEPRLESKWKLLPAAPGTAPIIEISGLESFGDERRHEVARRFRGTASSDSWVEEK